MATETMAAHCSFCGSNTDLRPCKVCEAPICRNCCAVTGECPKKYGHAQSIMPGVEPPASETRFVEASVAVAEPPAEKPKPKRVQRRPSKK